MKQRGFISLPFTGWIAIAAGVVILGLGVALKIQSARLDTCKAEYATFKAEVKVLGDAAVKAAKERDAADKVKKEKADVQNAKSRRDLDGLYAAYRGLRDSRSRSGGLSEAPTFAPSADRSCFNSAKFVGAVENLETGVLTILERGDGAIVDLDGARAWAQER